MRRHKIRKAVLQAKKRDHLSSDEEESCETLSIDSSQDSAESKICQNSVSIPVIRRFKNFEEALSEVGLFGRYQIFMCVVIQFASIMWAGKKRDS